MNNHFRSTFPVVPKPECSPGILGDSPILNHHLGECPPGSFIAINCPIIMVQKGTHAIPMLMGCSLQTLDDTQLVGDFIQLLVKWGPIFPKYRYLKRLKIKPKITSWWLNQPI